MTPEERAALVKYLRQSTDERRHAAADLIEADEHNFWELWDRLAKATVQRGALAEALAGKDGGGGRLMTSGEVRCPECHHPNPGRAGHSEPCGIAAALASVRGEEK